MHSRDVVMAGGSAGSLVPLRQLVAGLPAGLPGWVAVAVHTGENARSLLPQILSRSGVLPAGHARMGEPLVPGRVYVASPGRHLLVPGGVAELSRGPKMNRSRPAVDALFASGARWFGDRAVAVVLSGLLGDGAVGAALVAQAGGVVVVQEPAEAAQPSMPRAALAATPGAVAVPGARLGEVVAEMLGEGGLERWPRPEPARVAENGMDQGGIPRFEPAAARRPVRLACPDCGGALAGMVLPQITCYRCHVGHQSGPQSLAAAQAESAEAKLWAAVAALEETAVVARHLAEQAGPGDGSADRHRDRADWPSIWARAVRTHMGDTPADDTGNP